MYRVDRPPPNPPQNLNCSPALCCTVVFLTTVVLTTVVLRCVRGLDIVGPWKTLFFLPREDEHPTLWDICDCDCDCDCHCV